MQWKFILPSKATWLDSQEEFAESKTPFSLKNAKTYNSYKNNVYNDIVSWLLLC